MTALSIELPAIGQPDKTQDPKINTAFTAVQTWANGNIGDTNIASGRALVVTTTKYNGLKKYTKAEAEAGVEASATRPAFVSTNAAPNEPLFVAGFSVGPCFLILPGQKWTSLFAIEASTLLL